MVALHIPDIWLSQVKRELAGPKVDEVLLSNEEIREICIFPAMVEYFNRWPLKVPEFYSNVRDEMTIPYPDSETIGVMDVRFVGKTSQEEGNVNSDFFSIIKHQALGLSSIYKSTGRYGVRTGGRLGFRGNGAINRRFAPEGLQYQYINNRQLISSLSNLETFKAVPDWNGKQIRVYASTAADLEVVWGKYSYDFNEIKFSQRLNVCKIASAYALEQLAGTGRIMEDGQAEKQLRVSDLESRAEKLREDVYSKWDEYPTTAIFRGS